MVEILARLPEEKGKCLNTSLGGARIIKVVEDGHFCESCDELATVVVKGEQTDTEFELVYLCDMHLGESRTSQEDWFAAADVEDRPGFFTVGEGWKFKDLEIGGSVFFSTTSWKEAVAHQRHIQKLVTEQQVEARGDSINEYGSVQEWEDVIDRYETMEADRLAREDVAHSFDS